MGKECEVVLEAEGYWVWLSIVRLISVHNLEPVSWSGWTDTERWQAGVGIFLSPRFSACNLQ